jgi:hypothetical protein
VSEKDTQAVQQAQKAAAAKGAETEKAQQDVQQQAARSGGGDTLPPESPYQSYDFMPLSELQALADQRGVTINPDVLKAHLVTELRAHQSGATSPTSRRGVR